MKGSTKILSTKTHNSPKEEEVVGVVELPSIQKTEGCRGDTDDTRFGGLKMQGSVRSKEVKVQEIIISYFRGIFASQSPSEEVFSTTLNTVHPKVTVEMNEHFIRPFTKAKVRNAVFSILPHKSPMPDDRGLCQGDPISHYVFLFVAEVFSSMLQAVTEQGELEGIAISRSAPRIRHLLFVDYTIIFGRATERAMQTLVWVLENYAVASGQEINLEKSSIVISHNIGEEHQRILATILGVRVVLKHEKYHGLPAIASKSRSQLFQSVRDRIWARIDKWNSILLSQAGMPNYVLEEVEAISANFLWHNRGEKRTHWLRWLEVSHSFDESCEPLIPSEISPTYYVFINFYRYQVISNLEKYLRSTGPSIKWMCDGNDQRAQRDNWDPVWHSRTPPKVQMIVWRACQEAIPT
ncbi:hypothetical protein Sango_1255300 [Sesamum angolense]|uniref:Reverse transcriptase domain-containing protein n=1 Tax=Sesamum angolense TaxID=2727404 RepID=A0AAE1WRC0_9LAMI|nr:hypothetical protein Sango_1255300 [Sesamum angolense]